MNTVFWYLYSYSISSAFILWIHFVKKNFERVIYIYVYWRIKLLNLPVRVIKPARAPLSSRFAAWWLHLGFQSYVLGWCQGWVANHMLLVFSQYISLAPFCLHHKSHSHICNGLLSISLCVYRTVLISMSDVNFCYHVVKIGIAWYQMIHCFVYFSLLWFNYKSFAALGIISWALSVNLELSIKHCHLSCIDDLIVCISSLVSATPSVNSSYLPTISLPLLLQVYQLFHSLQSLYNQVSSEFSRYCCHFLVVMLIFWCLILCQLCIWVFQFKILKHLLTGNQQINECSYF